MGSGLAFAFFSLHVSQRPAIFVEGIAHQIGSQISRGDLGVLAIPCAYMAITGRSMSAFGGKADIEVKDFYFRF
jgi:hypothetical protein